MRNLQTAWEAIEKGDRVEAQSLVAQILRDDPKNAEAWMVLGEAVSGERQVLFLRKALQLNPDLEPARERLEQLEAEGVSDAKLLAEVPPVVEVPPDVVLDAPTVAIADRVHADRSAPQKAKVDKTKAQNSKSTNQSSNIGNTIILFILGIAILVVLFFLIQSIPG